MKKISYVILLAVLILGYVYGNIKVYAAEIVDITRSCFLTLETPKVFRKELSEEKIYVRLYRVADIASDGTYKDIPGYEALCLEELTYDATANQLKKKAEEVAVYLGADTWKTNPQVVPEREFEIVNNQGTQTDIEPGMYLVCAKSFTVGKNTYQTLPYIIALPNFSEYTDNDGNWRMQYEYDLVMELKLAQRMTPDAPQEPIGETVQLSVVYQTGDDMKLLRFDYLAFFGAAVYIFYYVKKHSRESRK